MNLDEAPLSLAVALQQGVDLEHLGKDVVGLLADALVVNPQAVGTGLTIGGGPKHPPERGRKDAARARTPKQSARLDVTIARTRLRQADGNVDRHHARVADTLGKRRRRGKDIRSQNPRCVVYRDRGELERAEEMLQKSLAIEEALGRKGGIATS